MSVAVAQTSPIVVLELKRPELILTTALIGGERSQASTGERFSVKNPATGVLISTVPVCGAAEAVTAVEAAANAFPDWKARTAKERSAVLKRWFTLMIENQEDLAKLISLEQGKPLAESRGEVA
jgi:succinate-semialdehyde dehydrogenase/glutarate-semialdehyde dehydrogenase